MSFGPVTARAFANVALVKYFGKRNVELNLPAAGSLSVTLSPLETLTKVCPDPVLCADLVLLNGQPASESVAARIVRHLDLLRSLGGNSLRVRVETENRFPTAAGLASSASGFAALTLAGAKALGLELSTEALGALARRGSGSACRSMVEGIGVWSAGNRTDGEDSIARSIAQSDSWDLRMVVGITDPGPKKVGSSDAMERTRTTSPYYDKWIDTTRRILEDAVQAVHQRDFSRLGDIVEHSALSMHAAAMGTVPGIVFFNGTTIEAFHLTRRLRKEGVEAYFTCDAGPQPKLLCRALEEEAVATALSALPGITDVIRCRPGPGAQIVGRE